MTNLIILILLVGVLLILLNITKDIISPPVILSAIWALPFLWLVISEGIGKGGYNINSIALYYVLGVIIFVIGYFACNPRIQQSIEKIEVSDTRKMTRAFKIFIIIENFFTFYWLYDVYLYVMGNFKYNFWFTYKWNVSMGNYSDMILIPYLRTASRIITCIMFVQFLIPNHCKKDTKWFWMQFFITAVLNLLGQGRGGVFSFIIPMAIIFVMMRRKSNAHTIKIGCRVIVLLIVIFVIYANLKNPYENSTTTPIMSTIENYLCGGVVAFVDWINSSHHNYGNGAYTFRFFLAIIKAFGFNVKVVPMVEEYATNINGNIGNVYTFYKWYANDFGLVYSMLCQFIVGMMHGYITKKTYAKRTQKWLFVFAMSFYPLVMQFFMDGYITMLSVWIQTVFWMLILLNTRLFYRRFEIISNEGNHL